MEFPLITVIPSIFTAETPFAELDAEPLGTVVRLDTALETVWPGDASALNYACPDLPHRYNDTLRKAAGVDELAREIFTGALRVGVVFADLDIVPHGETPALSPEGAAFLADHIPAPLPPWCGLYLTPFGARLFGVLPEVVSADYTESANAAFFGLLTHAGFKGVDESLKKWNRLNRLPRIYRADVGRTDPGEIIYPTQPVPIHAGALTRCALGTGALNNGADDAGPCPDIPADYAPFIPESLRLWADVLTGVRPLASSGGRHNALNGLLSVVFNRVDGCDAEHAFRLVIRAVRACGLPEAEAWKQCAYRAATHTPIAPEDGPPASAALESAARAEAFLGPLWENRLIVYNTADPDKAWVYDPRIGRFNSSPVASKILDRILPVWWKTGANPLPVPLQHQDGEKWKPYTPGQLQTRYGIGVGEVEICYTQPRDAIVYSNGTYTARLSFVGMRPDATPAHNPEVAAWLEALDPSGRLNDWLAWAPELDDRLPALVLQGTGGVGKTLLANSLASLWGPAPVSWEAATSNSASALTTMPLIFRDEAPSGGAGSDAFRRITGASSIPIVEKYRPTVMLEGSPRVIIASNEKSVITFRKENLSHASADAVRQRIVFVEVDATAKEWVKTLGPDVIKSWVTTADRTGDIARHILWLNKHARPPRAQDRFAVPASGLDTRSLEATSSGTRELLHGVCAVLDAYRGSPLPEGWRDMRVTGRNTDADEISRINVLGVTPAALEREFKTHGVRGNPGPGGWTDNLRMASALTQGGQVTIVARVAGRCVRVWPLRLDLIAHAAEESGYGFGDLELTLGVDSE